MNKFLCILFLVISANVFAQNYNSLLYQVTKQNEDTSYIYGTIHLSKKDLFEVNKKLVPVFNKVDSVYFEILSNEAEAKQLMMPYLLGDTLKTIDLLPSDKKQLVVDFVKNNLGTEIFLNYRPIIVFMMLAQTMYAADDVLPMDFHFMNVAKVKNKGLGQLETMEVQFNLLNSIPLKEQVDEIVRMIEEQESDKKELLQLMNYYKSQDLQKIHDFIIEHSDDNGFIDSKEFLDSRNEKMIPKIIKINNNGGALFFVGAGHLLGEKGLLPLLTKQGYTITPLK